MKVFKVVGVGFTPVFLDSPEEQCFTGFDCGKSPIEVLWFLLAAVFIVISCSRTRQGQALRVAAQALTEPASGYGGTVRPPVKLFGSSFFKGTNLTFIGGFYVYV